MKNQKQIKLTLILLLLFCLVLSGAILYNSNLNDLKSSVDLKFLKGVPHPEPLIINLESSVCYL